MKLLGPALLTLLTAALISVAAIHAGSGSAGAAAVVPLKDAKLNIEHNATDEDTGFQGFVDSEGWRQLDVRGPGGQVLRFEARGTLAKLGLTELFFESVEPENRDVPIEEMLAKLPKAGTRSPVPARRTAQAPAAHPAAPGSRTTSRPAPSSLPPRTARLEDDRGQAGDDRRVPAHHRAGRRATPAHDGKLGLSIYVPRTVTSIAVPNGFLLPRTAYKWEVLAIERSGNQTLSSGSFRTC